MQRATKMNPLWLSVSSKESLLWASALLIPYCTLAFGVHGGEFIQNINRQVRNLICALPFALVGWWLSSAWGCSLAWFILSYIGANLGFDWFPTTGWKFYGGLAIKGLLTCPLGGFITLPLAYFIGYKTKYTNVLAEYLSGTLYSFILLGVIYATTV